MKILERCKFPKLTDDENLHIYLHIRYLLSIQEIDLII
jgi:hypothetical protein